MSEPAQHLLPGDPGWRPSPMESAAWAVIHAGRTVLVYARTTLTKTERRRRLAAARPTLLAVFLVGWTAAGTISLSTGQGLFMSVVWAAVVGLCACMTWMGLLWSALLAKMGSDTSPPR